MGEINQLYTSGPVKKSASIFMGDENASDQKKKWSSRTGQTTLFVFFVWRRHGNGVFINRPSNGLSFFTASKNCYTGALNEIGRRYAMMYSRASNNLIKRARFTF